MNRRLACAAAALAATILLAPPLPAHLPGQPKKSASLRRVVNLPAADFTLTDQEGRRFTFSSLRGKNVVVTFVYTTCPDVCPLITAKVAQLQRLLKEKRYRDFHLVSITTDPEIDRPEVLKAYAERFNADLSTWTFLTGSRSELRPVWESFGVNVKKRGKGLVQHTGVAILVDSRGVRRLEFHGDEWRAEELLAEIGRAADRS
jgi:protein SCO1/2